MKNFSIKSFTILGLFGKSDISIPFNKDIKILIGENGLGKTQVLEILYYALTRNFVRLSEYYFDSIKIDFQDVSITISKKELSNVVNLEGIDSFLKRIIDLIGINELLKLRNEIVESQITRRNFRNSFLFDKIDSDISPDDVYDYVLVNNKQIKAMFNFDEILQKNELDNVLGTSQVLYIPMFRQLKEYFRWYNLEHYSNIQFEINSTIDFGMDDVNFRISVIINKLNKLIKDGFSKISSEILSQLVKGLPTIDNNFLTKINQNDIEIILARVGNSISQEDKDRIKNIVSTREIQDKDHSLLYFLQKLIDIYEQQRELDNAVKQFVTISNKYLVNKQVIYDESAVSIYIQDELSDKPLLLSKLSSGEKQIISIFSKIYLTTDDTKYIVIIDEPELSLSVIWQEMLLPDILKSNKCIFLLAATHSPFIYENELDKYAIGLHEYITKTKK